MVRRLALVVLIIIVSVLIFLTGDTGVNDVTVKDFKIVNPYESIDWNNINQYKGNLHTHTNYHGGRLKIEDIINRYLELDYSILSITEHNFVNWPWPLETEILAVKGSEISAIEHDLGAYFTSFDKSKLSVAESLEEIKKDDGIAVLFHPGRYRMDINWYKELFSNNDHLIGLEVINQGNRYKEDEKTWDRILTESMPQRPVWGFANDDMHIKQQLGRDWNVFLLPELTEEALRSALQEGEFFFSTISTSRRAKGIVPAIKEIEVNEDEGKIKIIAKDYSKIAWISECKEIHRGNELYYNDVKGLGVYVRAVVSGPGGQTFTQPFGIISEQ